MPVSGTTKHENPPLPPFGKGGMGGFSYKVARKDASPPLIIFDEIHKYRDWKNYLKGVYDGSRNGYRFLVSGSARLDIYQKQGKAGG